MLIDNTITDHLLKHKRDDREEFMITLFEKCNLSCAFCWQNHDSDVGLDTIRSKVEVLVRAAAQSPKQIMLFNLMGGEMFAENVFTDERYDDYVYLITETNRQVIASGKSCEFTCCTNLIFPHPERVLQLLHQLQSSGIKIKFTTSYDFSGRFNSSTIKTFEENVRFFKSDVINISIVLTAPNIREMLKNNDATFTSLYNDGFKIFFDYYSPEQHADVMVPSDGLLLEAFYFLLDTYPNSFPVNDWLHKHTNGLSCKSSYVILPDGNSVRCGSVPDQHTIKFFKRPEDMTNEAMEVSFVEQMGCIQCEYFKRCSLGCFLQHYFKARGELNECVFKVVYDKITKSIVNDEIYNRMLSRRV